MVSILPGFGSVFLSVPMPYEDDGVTPRDDLIGMKVWVSLTPGFSPVDVNNHQTLTPDYDGPSLSCEIRGLAPGVVHYVRYALVSLLDPEHLEASAEFTCTPESLSSSLSVVMSNDSHVLPASSAGAVSSYTGSGTTIKVYEGASELQAGGSGPGTFQVGSPTLSVAASITPGVVTHSGTSATVAQHSAMSSSVASVVLTFPITVTTSHGETVVLEKAQSLSKSAAGATGSTGAAATAYWMLKSAVWLPRR